MTREEIADLSESERWEYLIAQIKAGKGPRAGRPRKNSDIPKWSDFGFTRQQVWKMRRMAEIPEDVVSQFCAAREAKDQIVTTRGLLVAGGKVNVIDENVFDGTGIGQLAVRVLEPVEKIFSQMNKVQSRWFLLALRFRLKQIKRNVISENDLHEGAA
jgi:hypothetical protein